MKNCNKNIFEFCLSRKNAKMSTDELLVWLELDFPDYGESIEIDGRYMRRIGDGNLFQLSCLVKDFDRWALSGTNIYFDLNIASERRRFIRYIQDVRSKELELVV